MSRITNSIPPPLSWTTLAICSWHAVETLHNLEYARNIMLHPAIETIMTLAGVAAGLLLLHGDRSAALVRAERRSPARRVVERRADAPIEEEELIVIVRRRRIERRCDHGEL
jgi:hypothetical protein